MNIMKSCEETLYLNMMKSIVTNFDDFVSDIDKYEIILSDEFLVSSLRKVAKNLQRVINKWDRLEQNNKQKYEDNISSFENKKREKPFSALNLSIIYPETNVNTAKNNESKFIDSASCEKKNEHENKKKKEHPQFVKKVFRIAKAHCEDSESEQESDSDETNRELDTEFSATHKNRTLKTSSTDENYIVKKMTDVYACTLCKINNLQKSNIESHKQGKQHINNLKNRDLSSTKLDCDIGSILNDVSSSLISDKNGRSFISEGSCYSCVLCNVSMNSKLALKQHVEGAKHKKLCQNDAV